MEEINVSELPTVSIIITMVVGTFAVAQKMSQFLKTWMYCHFTYSEKIKIRLLVENP